MQEGCYKDEGRRQEGSHRDAAGMSKGCHRGNAAWKQEGCQKDAAETWRMLQGCRGHLAGHFPTAL